MQELKDLLIALNVSHERGEISDNEYKLEIINALSQFKKQITVVQFEYLIDIILYDNVFDGGNIWRPSDFVKIQPFDSTMKRSELEDTMRWMCDQLMNSGNVFRNVDFTEYKNDWKGVRNEEDFAKFQMYMTTVSSFITFSPAYKEHYDNLLKSTSSDTTE